MTHAAHNSRQPHFQLDLNAALARQPVTVDLGCGEYKHPGAIGIDRLPLPGVDIVADLNLGLPFLPDRSVDRVVAVYCLEHLTNPAALLEDIARVLRPDGRARLYVRHIANARGWADPTAVKPWALFTIGHFCRSGWRYWGYRPRYLSSAALHLVSQRLIFESRVPPWHALKKLAQAAVNLSPAVQRAFEQNLAWVFPPAALEIELAVSTAPQYQPRQRTVGDSSHSDPAEN